MRPFGYSSVSSINEVLAGLGGGARALAGGTDLLTLMKADIVAPPQLLDIKQLRELGGGIRDSAGGLEIGALTTLSEIEADPQIARRYPVLGQAAALAATPQLRNMATLGGNLLQRPRCWYFRNPQVHCWLKGGEHCPAREGENRGHALFGGGPCHAVHPSDVAPALLALDAELRLRGPSGERSLPLAKLFEPPTPSRRTETVLGERDLIIAVRIPPPADGSRSVYLKAMDRKAWSFALVAAAVALRFDGQSIADARVVLGGVAPVPWRATAAERALLGAQAAAPRLDLAAEAALQGAAPLRHNGYKVPLARALVRRALGILVK
jgi:xanthine dehydrogenase YagS FAD-binding subunit